MSENSMIQFHKKYDQLNGLSDKAFLEYAGFINLQQTMCEKLYTQLLDDCFSIDGKRTEELPYGEYIICLFRDFLNRDRHFIALKPVSDENILKYFYKVGQIFEVKINE